MTCEKSGDCRLQDYAFRYEVKSSDFGGAKKEYDFDDSNPYISRNMNKCVLCGKCVRTCQDVEDRGIISFAYRGFKTKVSTAMDSRSCRVGLCFLLPLCFGLSGWCPRLQFTHR